MSRESQGGQLGGGLLGMLFLLLCYLKLTDQITMSWLGVTAPLWAPVCVGVVLAVLAIVCVYLFVGAQVAWKWLRGSNELK